MAVAYGFDYSQTLGVRVPAITLLGRNEKPLRKAFEEFSSWASWTDADAIEVTIIFMRDGGYRLCINPEIGALYQRAFRYDTVVNPMAFQVTWIKRIETTSKPLQDMRKMLSTGITRPFLLVAACYRGISLNARTFDPALVEQISQERELLKFEIRFVDEGSGNEPHWQRIASAGQDLDRESISTKPSTPKTLVWTRRKEAMKRLFPVTLWRSKSDKRGLALRSTAKRLGMFDWQIDQAFCNLSLSREIAKGELHFRGLPKRNWQDQLWRALGDRFEVANGDQYDFRALRPGNMLHQTVLDGRMLLKHYGVKRVSRAFQGVQKMLQRHSLHCEPQE